MPSRKDEEEEPEEFKVVDRRLFTPEGELRRNLPPEAAPPEPPPAAAKVSPQPSRPTAESAATGQPAASPESGAAKPDAPGPVQFDHLIMSLATSAMYHLGMAARPGEAPPPPDLPAARETIDMLALLQAKTKGNLTPEEEKLLSGTLQELRLVYVEITRQAGRIR